jgi:hypothetical protein
MAAAEEEAGFDIKVAAARAVAVGWPYRKDIPSSVTLDGALARTF